MSIGMPELTEAIIRARNIALGLTDAVQRRPCLGIVAPQEFVSGLGLIR